MKLQILFSEALPLFGTIIAKALTTFKNEDSPATKKIFDTFSKMKTTAYPPETVSVKSSLKSILLIKFS